MCPLMWKTPNLASFVKRPRAADKSTNYGEIVLKLHMFQVLTLIKRQKAKAG